MPSTKKKPAKKKTARIVMPDVPACELCGKKIKPRMKTPCCGHWICDDECDYVLFSYARNCCSRNHRRFTLCGFHYNEEHPGDWKTCKKCRESFEHELEMYVWYGTNEYNFETLKNPPKFPKTHCAGCGKVIRLPHEGYTCFKDLCACEDCMADGFDLHDAAGEKPMGK